MVAVVVALLLFAGLIFATVRFVQWMRGTGPFDRNPLKDAAVGEQRRALRDEIHSRRAEERPAGTDDLGDEPVDLNDEWLASREFGPPGPGGTDSRR